MKINWSVVAALVLVISPVRARALEFDPALPDPLRQQISNDLSFAASMRGQGQTALHQLVFGAFDGTSYQSFFESRIKKVGLNDCGNKIAVACVIPSKAKDKMWLTPNYTSFDKPQIARLMIIFHEARHTEKANGFWSHDYCPKPFVDSQGQPIKSIWTGIPLAGQPACDSEALGSYGISVIQLKNIEKSCTSCTEKVRMDGKIYGDDQFQRIVSKAAHEQLRKDLY